MCFSCFYLLVGSKHSPAHWGHPSHEFDHMHLVFQLSVFLEAHHVLHAAIITKLCGDIFAFEKEFSYLGIFGCLLTPQQLTVPAGGPILLHVQDVAVAF